MKTELWEYVGLTYFEWIFKKGLLKERERERAQYHKS